jgi:hypothetical protein
MSKRLFNVTIGVKDQPNPIPLFFTIDEEELDEFVGTLAEMEDCIGHPCEGTFELSGEECRFVVQKSLITYMYWSDREAK